MVHLDVDIAGAVAHLTDVQQKQIPFATSKALNAIGLDVQRAERGRLRSAFTLRRPEWADRSVKISHFAKKAEPWVTVAIAPPGDRGDILGKFEDQTVKRPIDGGQHLAIAVGANRTKNDIVRTRDRPKAMNLHSVNGKIVGDRGTFLVKLPGGKALILQRSVRSAKGRIRGYKGAGSTNRVLFLLVPQARIRPDLRFVPTAADVVNRMWNSRMGEALAAALETAR